MSSIALSSAFSVILASDHELRLQDHTITCRASDGYVNLTELCRAGKKLFGNWNSNKKAKAFLQVLSASIGIPISALVTYESGSIENRITWGHPQVAINIAQWISPHFDVQVSRWVFELVSTGKVELGNERARAEIEALWKAKCEELERANIQLQEEKNRLQGETEELKLQVSNLQKTRPLRRRPRPKFPKGFFIYFAATKLFRTEGEIKIGKTDNLKDLHSTYNRLTKTVFIYYRHCGDKQNMDSAEAIIFKHLAKHRKYENGEKFSLKDKELSFFVEKANKVIDMVTDTEDPGILCTENLSDLEVEDDFKEEGPDEEELDRSFIKQVDKNVRDITEKNRELETKLSEVEYRLVFEECNSYTASKLREVCKKYSLPHVIRHKRKDLIGKIKSFIGTQIVLTPEDLSRGNEPIDPRKTNECKDCGTAITKVSTRCRTCEGAIRKSKNPKKPPAEYLRQELEVETYMTLAKKYEVCTMTIRRWAAGK